MKILKIFGVVVGIHVFALILIFANPGCSSAQQPTASETVIAGGDAPNANAPAGGEVSPLTAAPGDTTFASVPPSFDPNAPAPAVRFSPTRPGTPAAATLEAQPVADVTPASTYTVAKGDSLWTIARRQNSTVAEIAAANNIKPSATVRVGQRLIIPAKAVPGSSPHVEPTDTSASVPVAPAAKRSTDTVKHVVKPGETLGAIARKYQVKVGEIATANNISDPARIRPGMELTIPGWQAPASRSSRTTATPRPATPAPVETPAAPAPSTAPADSVPTIVIAPAEQDLDSALKTKTGEPPVIEVEEK
jgi:LysM repeat protein